MPAQPAASPPAAAAPAMLFARVRVNTVDKGDVAIRRDERGHTLVPLADLRQWGLPAASAAPIVIDGESYVDVLAIPGVTAAFDPANVALDLKVDAGMLPSNLLNLGPERRANVVYPTDTSVFLNYGLNASGDDTFNQRQYQLATEFGARTGHWLLYNTTSQQWGDSPQNGFVRLQTNLQYDERAELRTWTFGDYFTPSFDLNASVPMGGASLTKLYSMDPYFVQYPTAAFQTDLAFPSTVQVRIDGNLVAQRQVQPGPLAITNITNGIPGGQNVAVVIRDPFGREQVLAQPFFFATNVGLAQGLHEYSYNVGALRREYGVRSNDYGDFAASAFHRYAFTNQLTLGLRGQATQDLYNIGPFGTWQSPLGIVGAGVAIGGRNGDAAPAGSAAYSYTGRNYSLSLGALYRARDYAQLSDLTGNLRVRSNQYASGSLFFPQWGTLTATYNGIASFDAPDAKLANFVYTRSFLGNKGLLSVNYVKTIEPQSSSTWLVSFRYFFDTTTSLVGAVGGGSGGQTQAVTLSQTVPQGEGVGYELTAGRFDSVAPDAMFGRAFVQANAAHASFGAEYAKASRPEGGPGLTRLFVAGSIGGVGGRVFAARPVQDSFAVVSVPGMPDLPVYANGWYVGNTNASGDVVATNIASYYDNFISFSTKELPLDYVFPASESVISPSARSGTLVTFDVRKNYSAYGTLRVVRDGVPTPIEFREFVVTGEGRTLHGFTARRGEFYVDGLTPGTFVVELEGAASCRARFTVPKDGDAMRDVGALDCERP